jgi:zinc/manganese transport system ATP-binding protein
VHAIEFEGLSLRRGGRIVLEGVDAAIEMGEFIGVFGPNGSGKTTLLHAILGLLRPAAGTIRVFGAAPGCGNRNAGYLPQRRGAVGDLAFDGFDFVASALDGERWGLPLVGRNGRREVEWAIATVEAEALGERPLSELSGGEMQRILLAQALLGRPKLLLLDEPLISLDPHYERVIVTLVKHIQTEYGITVLFTAHEVNPLIGAMDRVLYLGRGRAAIGRVEEVITGEVLSRLYGTTIEVLHLGDRIIVVSGHGPVEAEAHRHDA